MSDSHGESRSATPLAARTDHQAFCYDERNRLTWAGSVTGTPPCGGSLSSGTLTSAAYGPFTLAYDELDRLTSGPSGALTYADSAHLDAVTSSSTGVNSTYSASYDAAGHMVCRNTGGGGTGCGSTAQGLTYDNEGRLVKWVDNVGYPTVTQTMAYDGEGHRVALSVNGATTSYLGPLEEVSGSSTLTKYITTGTGLPTAERVGTGGTLSYLASDGLGSVSEALDGSGTVTFQQLYTPAGAVRFSTGASPTSYAFTGQRADSQTGLDDYNARYYDPTAQTFMSADRVSDGLNRYAYVHDNPETLTDPSGNRAAGCVHEDGEWYCPTPPPTPPTTPPPPPGCQATHDCPPPPPPPTGCQATGDCPGSDIGGAGNIVLESDLGACDSAFHPAWCDKYYDYSSGISYAFDGNDILLKRPWQDLMAMADFWILTAGVGALIAGLYAEVYYIPSLGQWWSPRGAVISYGGWVGLSLGFDGNVAVGFGLLFTRNHAASAEELRDFLAGPSSTHEQDYGLHGWVDESNSAGYAWEFHVGVFAAGATGGQSCGLLSIFHWPPQFNACRLP